MGKYLKLVWIAAVWSVFLAGCAGRNGMQAGGDREQVTIAFWGDQLTEQYGEYLQESFPEVDFTFYAATNSTDFYRFKQEHGDLPDILTVRRFALRDVADWKDSLLDLSDTELANTFYQSYLRSYTYSDGSINWLPVCAEVDSIIVNKTLLEENDLAVPANYGEFADVCSTLQEKGIRPFVSNFAADYTCMEVLQGLSAPVLTSQEGREWRQSYESGQIDRLSEEVWLPVFEKMEEFISCTGINASDLEYEHEEIFRDFVDGKMAMVRGTGDEVVRYSEEGRELVLMPYYGDTEAENWYLTYPAFQIAASAQAEESPERRELILDIMSAMLSGEGQQKISANQNMVPYNSGVTIELSEALADMQPYIDSNQLYIRLASADMFAVSQQVVQGMLTGEYPDARAAFDAFNAALEAEREEPPKTVQIEKGYSYAFDPDGGSPAASAVMNSVRESAGTQLLIGPAVYVAGNISDGDYTEAELPFLTMGETVYVYLCSMTGDQVYQYMDYVLTTPGKRGSVINDTSLYVTSGFEMTVVKSEAGYALEQLSAGGKELDRKTTYSVALVGNDVTMLGDALKAAGVTKYTKSESTYKEMVVDRLAGGGQLEEPTSYITLILP